MSVIIKGFDTDGNCLHCFFQSEDTDRCLLTDDDIPLYGKGHPESCPLVPLPEGHGRLIDENDLLVLFNDEERFGYLDVSDVCNAQTIVPAEGGGEDGDA